MQITSTQFQPLWSETRLLWDQLEKARGFEAYVPADYLEVYQALEQMRGKATTFLEWGSGLGVVTIMASLMGFEAYGIEIAPELVEHAQRFAEKYQSNASFATGSFVPNGYEWSPDFGEDGLRTDFDAQDAYDELGMDLSDFDIVYAYPWPDEHGVFCDIMKRFGSPQGLFMTYDVREGMSVRRNRKSRS